MPQNDGHKLFVGCLPPDITSEDLNVVFGTYGEVADIHVMPAAKSKFGHACAFVSYVKREAGEDAIAVLNDVYKIREGSEVLPIKVSWARPNNSAGYTGDHDWGKAGYGTGNAGCGNVGSGRADGGWHGNAGSVGGGGWQQQVSWQGTWQQQSWEQPGDWDSGHPKGGSGTTGDGLPGNRLFIGNLPADVGNDALDYVFSTYGKVNKIHIMTGRAKSGQACAFVEYSALDEAETAILTLHNKYEIRSGDGPIMVKHAGNRPRSTPY